MHKSAGQSMKSSTRVGSMLKLSRNSPVLEECCIGDCIVRLKEGELKSLSSVCPYVMDRFWMKVVLPVAGAPAYRYRHTNLWYRTLVWQWCQCNLQVRGKTTK